MSNFAGYLIVLGYLFPRALLHIVLERNFSCLEFMQVTKVVWDAASALLAVACLDETCTLWQKQDASWRRSMVLRSKAGRFTCMRFLPADHAVVTGASPYPCAGAFLPPHASSKG